MYFDCIIIGGGASGMTAAIAAAGNGLNTAILEHTRTLGKKILQTGNGKCNITNLNVNRAFYTNNNVNFVMSTIQRFDIPRTIDFFRNLGIYTKSRDGYIYPQSEQASIVTESLQLELKRLNVTIKTNIDIMDIKKTTIKEPEKPEQERDIFFLASEEEEFTCSSLILATGSKAAPKTGSDGSGYLLAKMLGHTIIDPLPALVQLKSPSRLCKIMAGVRSEGSVALYIDNHYIKENRGEIQFTDYGVSGIPVFQVSSEAVKALHKGKKVHVLIDLYPYMDFPYLYQLLMDHVYWDVHKSLEQFLAGYLNKKLASAVLKSLLIDSSREIGEIKDLDMVISNIASEMKHLSLLIDGSNGFDSCQVCSGGVRTTEINPITMESKIHENLYLVGELVDVEGICGGYNLQWAWSTGYQAGLNAAQKFQPPPKKRGRKSAKSTL